METMGARLMSELADRRGKKPGDEAGMRRMIEELDNAKRAERIPSSTRQAAIRSKLVSTPGVYLFVLQTRLGWMGIAAGSRGINSLILPRPSQQEVTRRLQAEFPQGIVQGSAPDEIARPLSEYAEGRCRRFALDVDLSGVRPFHRRVLEAIQDIPFGETRSYGWVAREIGEPKAARAVGRALARNPIPIIIPCHRVIASSGGLGGYGGGLPLKRKLLQLEGCILDI